MVGVSLANDLDAEVVDDEIESGWACDMMEKARGVASGDVAIIGEMLDELDVGQAASLGKAVHAALDLGEELFVFNEWTEVIFFHDIVGNGPLGNVKVFVLAGVGEGGDEVEIGKIEA